MRADRLLSIMLLLQVRRRITARELAKRLEVSERTIYRDMEALSSAGVPVTAERGTGGGLVLEVMTSGSKIWRYRYSLHGKQQPLVTIGEYPAIGLQDARERARRYAEIVAGGVSPVADAKKDRGAVKSLDSIKEFAEFWFQSEIADKSPTYRQTTRRALEKDIYPAIGNKSLPLVTAGDVLAICDRIKGRGSPQATAMPRDR